jgi:adenylylsulfate kinase-like enzyme
MVLPFNHLSSDQLHIRDRVMEGQNNAAILIVTGPSGAGKTTIACALIEKLPDPEVLLHADYFWLFIERGLVTPHRTEARAQNATVIAAAAAATNA